MLDLLWLVPTLPFAGFLILALFGKRLSKNGIPIVGAGSIGISALITLLIAYQFTSSPPPDHVFTQTLWSWVNVGSFNPSIAFHLDALSLIFIFVITFVGFFIHLYSVEFMREDEGYARFFAYMNLFVGSMLVLVLADNLMLLYLGWEGVGLCSYLLIGFWYREPANGRAARKAFIMTRVGDTAMAIGLFMLFQHFSTLHIGTILEQAPQKWLPGSNVAVAIALLLLGGAVGKSGQIPLQSWLPDAMAGPSPVSALIHAATMVTAGVYLIARTNVLFTLAPLAQNMVAVVGAVTLLIAGFSALTQHDIKRTLAYSTISQIGYMFLALGIGAWSAAIFHFMTHAFFKALLFLSAGAVIVALHHEHDIFKMGGIRKKLPVLFWTFLAGAGALAALPLITSGFYSKDAILWHAFAGEKGGTLFWLAGLVGAFLTAIYTARLVILVFFGKAKTEVGHIPGKLMTYPLIILAVFSIVVGFIELPHNFGHVQLMSGFLATVLPAAEVSHHAAMPEWLFQLLAAALTLSGLYLAYLFLSKVPSLMDGLKKSYFLSEAQKLWYSGWGFDWVYNLLFVKPFVFLANINKKDIIDAFYTGLTRITEFAHVWIRKSQTGLLRWYVMGVVIGAVIVLAVLSVRN
jgi:NADH-quinone oxidoreductase subunit L